MLAIAPPLICGTEELDDLVTRVAQVIEKAAAWLA
jgi:adenosylmethionine-8-amino-7-oxononanoate aminotransferase